MTECTIYLDLGVAGDVECDVEFDYTPGVLGEGGTNEEFVIRRIVSIHGVNLYPMFEYNPKCVIDALNISPRGC